MLSETDPRPTAMSLRAWRNMCAFIGVPPLKCWMSHPLLEIYVICSVSPTVTSGCGEYLYPKTRQNVLLNQAIRAFGMGRVAYMASTPNLPYRSPCQMLVLPTPNLCALETTTNSASVQSVWKQAQDTEHSMHAMLNTELNTAYTMCIFIKFKILTETWKFIHKLYKTR